MREMRPILEKMRSIFKINKNGIDIYWHDFDKRVIVGHSGRPKKGDIFTTKMLSGKIGVFEVINVHWCNDPSNMYFADVKDVGYWITQSPTPEDEKEGK